MSDAPPPAPRRISFRPEIGALLLLTVLGITLGLSVSLGPVLGLVLATIGVASGALIHRSLGERYRTAAVVPMALLLGVLTIFAPAGFTSELLASGLGLGILLWLASEPYPRGRWIDASAALVIPLLAVLVGIVTSLILPTSPNFLAVAAGLFVAELLFAAYLYAHPSELAGAAEAAPS